MNAHTVVVSKVLVLDGDEIHADTLKSFCEECNLIGIKPPLGDEAQVMAILRSNVDLGGIFLYENFGGAILQGLTLAREIHAARPELPIFLRRTEHTAASVLSDRDMAIFRCIYTIDNLQHLRENLDASIFSRVYPNDLVRGITELTRAALGMLFRDCDIDVETPYLVKDRIIYGEVFTLMPIESSWCRGYMMLQAAEQIVLDLIRRLAGKDGELMTFRELNSVLGEATNMVWGAFKNRYVSLENVRAELLTQVPIIINHPRSYISFGSDDPQLCLKYTVQERNQPTNPPVPIFQRFVFNLSWSPDEFKENPTIEEFVESGELELF